MHKFILLIAATLAFNCFAKDERCENVASGANVVSPDGTKSIVRNNPWEFKIISNKNGDQGKTIQTVKVQFTNEIWEYLWSEDSRFLKATRVSEGGQIEALFIVDFRTNRIIYPYVLLTVGDHLERLTKVSLMGGDQFVLARYGENGTYEMLSVENGAVVRSTLEPKTRDMGPLRRAIAPQSKIKPGELPESL